MKEIRPLLSNNNQKMKLYFSAAAVIVFALPVSGTGGTKHPKSPRKVEKLQMKIFFVSNPNTPELQS